MNRIIEMTFVENMDGHDVGYMDFGTGTTEKQNFVIGYSISAPIKERFVLYTEDDQIVTLSDHLALNDIQRMEQAYFDLRTSDKTRVHMTAQLQDCFELSA